jgi:hypothetical protein
MSNTVRHQRLDPRQLRRVERKFVAHLNRRRQFACAMLQHLPLFEEIDEREFNPRRAARIQVYESNEPSGPSAKGQPNAEDAIGYDRQAIQNLDTYNITMTIH